MFNRLLLVVFSGYFLTACAALLPVHQVGSSRSLKKGTLQGSMLLGTAPTILSTNKDISKFKYYERSHGKTAGIAGFQLAYGLTNSIDLELEGLSGLGQGGTLSVVGFKYQYLGLPQHSIYNKDELWSGSVRLRAFVGLVMSRACKNVCKETDKDDGHTLRIESKGVSVANIWGYRLNPLSSVYGGFQFLQGEIKFSKDFLPANTDPSIEETREASLFGGVVGVEVATYRQRGINYFAHIELSPSWGTASYTDKKVFYDTRSLAAGLSYQF